MSNQPCYTCKDSFITIKRQELLNQKIEDVKAAKSKIGFTGIIAIVRRDNGTGFKEMDISSVSGEDVEQYLSFNQGLAI